MVGLPCTLNPKVIAPDNLQKIVKQVFAPEPYFMVEDEKVHVTQLLHIETNFDNLKEHNKKNSSNMTTTSSNNANYEPLLMIKPNYI